MLLLLNLKYKPLIHVNNYTLHLKCKLVQMYFSYLLIYRELSICI